MQQADQELQDVLNTAYSDVKAMLQRNRAALDEIIHQLCTPRPDHLPEEGQPFQGNTLPGSEVQEIVSRLCHPSDIDYRDRKLAVFM